MAKIDPYLRPLYDALYDMVDPEGAAKLLERGTVEVAPLAFMRGRTLNNSFIILDEAQNTTPEQMKMFLTRIGFGSKVVVTGDATQVDVADGRSGVKGLERILGGVENLAFVHLTACRRRAPPDRRRHRRRVRTQHRGHRGHAGIVATIDAVDPQGGGRWLTLSVPPASTLAGRSRSSPTTSRPTWRSMPTGGRRSPPHALRVEGRCGELTLTFVDRRRHRVAEPSSTWAARRADRRACRSRSTRPITTGHPSGPVLLGDVVVCPSVAAAQAADHAGTLDDELALLVVHGVPPRARARPRRA